MKKINIGLNIKCLGINEFSGVIYSNEIQNKKLI